MKRAGMLLEKITAGPVGILDADTEALKDPKPFMLDFPPQFEWQLDILARDMGQSVPDAHRISAGLVAFNNSPNGIHTLRQWVQEIREDRRKDLHVREQYYLLRAVERCSPRMRVLPLTYNYPVPEGKTAGPDTVVVHDFTRKFLGLQKEIAEVKQGKRKKILAAEGY